jgi:hypothetical protein
MSETRFLKMDLRIEEQLWHDFHPNMIVSIQSWLMPLLLPKYAAQIEERVYVEHTEPLPAPRQVFRPDVVIHTARKEVYHRADGHLSSHLLHNADNPAHQTALGAEVLDHSICVASFGGIIPLRLRLRLPNVVLTSHRDSEHSIQGLLRGMLNHQQNRTAVCTVFPVATENALCLLIARL